MKSLSVHRAVLILQILQNLAFSFGFRSAKVLSEKLH